MRELRDKSSWRWIDSGDTGKILNLTEMQKRGRKIASRGIIYPILCSSIISLEQLSEKGNKVVIHKDYLWVYKKQGVLLMKVKQSANRLYKIIIEGTSNECMMSKTVESSWLWHSRLGHMNFQAIQLLSSEAMAESIPNFVQPKKCVEDACSQNRCRSHFPYNPSSRQQRNFC